MEFRGTPCFQLAAHLHNLPPTLPLIRSSICLPHTAVYISELSVFLIKPWHSERRPKQGRAGERDAPLYFALISQYTYSVYNNKGNMQIIILGHSWTPDWCVILIIFALNSSVLVRSLCRIIPWPLKTFISGWLASIKIIPGLTDTFWSGHIWTWARAVMFGWK